MNEQQKKDFRIINGNNLEILDNFEPNSVDAVITDPPYELGFMGKKWDSTGIAYNVELWRKVLKVLKPGGYLLAFGGTRTFHRITVAIEDAGFEIRDCIMWLYGSGFPKSMNIGLAIDKQEGLQGQRGVGGFNVSGKQEQENRKAKLHIGSTTDGSKQKAYTDYKSDLAKEWAGWGTALKPAFEPIIMARKPIEDTVAKNCLKYGVGAINIDECRVPLEDGYKAPIRSEESQNYAAERKGLTQCDMGKKTDYAGANADGRFPANVITDGSDEAISGFPDTHPTKPHSGDGKPLDTRNNGWGFKRMPCTLEDNGGSAARYFYQAKITDKDDENNKGRFPANVITDGSEEVTENMPTTKGTNPKELGDYGFCFDEGKRDNKQMSHGYEDEGSVSRYFYCAKASKKDRDEGLGEDFESKQNIFMATHNGTGEASKGMERFATQPKKNFHPTVKPTNLMQYLVRLVSPKGATIMDIFNGSGSTGKAVAFENRERDAGYKYIGIELDPEYCAISEARIDYALNKYEYESKHKRADAKDTKDVEDLHQMSIFDFDSDEEEGE